MSSGLVLVIDDDEWVGRLLAVALRESGYEVLICASAVEGFEKAVEMQPDCIICDVDLPDVDGFWVARKIRMASSRVSVTPFLFLSGLDDRDTRIQGFHVGADVYMTKPFRIDEVVAQVGALVQMVSRLRQNRNSFLSLPPTDAAMVGDLAQMSIATVLTLLDMERRSGKLEVSSKDEKAVLLIDTGAITSATQGGDKRDPLELLRTLLTWNSGRFAFRPDVNTSTPTHDNSINALLMEAVRLEDETRASLLDPHEVASTHLPGRGKMPNIMMPPASEPSDSTRIADALASTFGSVLPPAPSPINPAPKFGAAPGTPTPGPVAPTGPSNASTNPLAPSPAAASGPGNAAATGSNASGSNASGSNASGSNASGSNASGNTNAKVGRPPPTATSSTLPSFQAVKRPAPASPGPPVLTPPAFPAPPVPTSLPSSLADRAPPFRPAERRPGASTLTGEAAKQKALPPRSATPNPMPAVRPSINTPIPARTATPRPMPAIRPSTATPIPARAATPQPMPAVRPNSEPPKTSRAPSDAPPAKELEGGWSEPPPAFRNTESMAPDTTGSEDLAPESVPISVALESAGGPAPLDSVDPDSDPSDSDSSGNGSPAGGLAGGVSGPSGTSTSGSEASAVSASNDKARLAPPPMANPLVPRPPTPRGAPARTSGLPNPRVGQGSGDK